MRRFTGAARPGPARPVFHGYGPLLALLLALAFTFTAWRIAERNVEQAARAEFVDEVRSTSGQIRLHLQAYTTALRGMQSLFAGNPEVDRADWRGYLAALDLQARYPGINQIVFVRRVPAAEREAFEQKVQRDLGWPGFQAWPNGDRAEYYPVEYVEPLHQNRASLGLDLGSEPERRAAMERAMRTGQPTPTLPVSLLLEPHREGFLILAPVYRYGTNPTTEEERNAALMGFVAAPVIVEDLIASVFGGSDMGLSLQIHTGGSSSADGRLLFDSRRADPEDAPAASPRFQETVRFDVAGQPWRLSFASRSRPGWRGPDLLPSVVLGAGLLVSALLAGVVWSVGDARRRAVALADEMTGELQRSNQELQALIAHMAEGVIAVDEERGLLVNPAASRILGMPGPFGDSPLEQVGFPEPLVEALQAALQAQGAAEATEIAFTCGGAELQARVSPVAPEAGAPLGAVALIQDITAQSRLRRMRENFVANVSHELRGPLASLSAVVEAMRDGLISEQGRPRYLQTILAEIDRLRRLTDDLLELSRLDAGMVRLPLEEFDLRPLCEAVAEKMGPRAASSGVSLTWDCPTQRVVANWDRVEEILSNFLDNALRYTPAGGSVHVAVTREGQAVRIAVADTGVGIAREHLPHIWDRFYKVDPARTRTPGGGTGLGLSIVRQLVELLGGEVAVESEPGQGSTFSFTLVAAADGMTGS